MADYSPLDGVKILDLTRALSGPFCTMILGDLGADVIKVEPIDGDMMRQWGPFDRTESVYYLTGNRNKRAIAIDFRSTEGLELIKTLAKECDVVVENFKPGSMDAMGLNYEKLSEINSRLIFMSITGFGRDGPNADQPGFDQIAQGYSGLMSVTGSPESGPLRVGVAIGDQTTGMWAAIGVLSALAQRAKTGVGHRIDTSLMASLVGLLSVQGQRYLSLGETPSLAGNNHPVVSPCGVFQTKDGPINIAANTPNMWVLLCNILDLKELVSDERFIDNASRAANRDALQNLIETKLEWSGILCEPAKIWHSRLRVNRLGPIDTGCVWSESGKTLIFNEVVGGEQLGELSTIDSYSNNDYMSKSRKKNYRKYNVSTISLSDLLKKYESISSTGVTAIK